MQILLRLYTTLLPNLRQGALNSAPSWAGGHAQADLVAGTNPSHDALAATIRREADAVLNVGHVSHSEGKQLALLHVIVPLAMSASCSSHHSCPPCDSSSRVVFPHVTLMAPVHVFICCWQTLHQSEHIAF